MDDKRPSPTPARDTRPPAQIAKAAFHRLALEKLEPTPANYARAYAAESGTAEPAAESLAAPVTAAAASAAANLNGLPTMLDRLVRGLERGGRSWTVARKKDSLQRVLDGNRTDPQRLVTRLTQLVASWGDDAAAATVPAAEDDSAGGTPSTFLTEAELRADPPSPSRFGALGAESGPAGPGVGEWPAVGASLHGTVQHALYDDQGRAAELMRDLDLAHARLAGGANAEDAQLIEALSQRARLVFDHRAHRFGEMGGLVRELTASIVDLAEDDSWAKGQCEAMNAQLEAGLSGRSLRSVGELLAGTRERQRTLRDERSRARDALKSLIHKMLGELGELGQHTDRFQDSVGRYAEVIEQADSLESLAGVVREMVEESRSVQSLVQKTQARLTDEHDRASALSARVETLEDELRRLSDEVQTDQLTQIANRRGLVAAFATEQASFEREGSSLALALLDIDNFKKLNDTLGHAAGDQALVALAQRVTQMLRPGDRVARYGGEEFVLMLPRTPLEEAVQVLTRLQRSLSASLFMHEGQQVFVTFSAGVTLYRRGETLELALDRADEALYEAKHTGKNRACVAP